MLASLCQQIIVFLINQVIIKFFKFSAMSYQSGQWTRKGMQQFIQFVKIEPWKNRKNTANKLVVKNTSSSEKVRVLKCLLLLWACSMRSKYKIIITGRYCYCQLACIYFSFQAYQRTGIIPLLIYVSKEVSFR